ncbi:hypothetical protein [Gaetbulibacter saemankumensis]|uniref:hypothetical protein n=1 Tax=Gaetbulibacter saemankumensis TaxID=311208 RepID=UPI000400C189|nr:hypothetical protein [Gaetbulibacter saemankumensis]
MKQLLIIAFAFLSIQSFAQQPNNPGPKKGQKMQKMMDLTPEEAANLQTKKMALHLDLTEAQQKEIYDLNLENAKNRKARMEALKAKREDGDMQKPTKEERYNMMNARLDRQIALKEKMKTILNEAQFNKWEKAQARMAENGKKRMNDRMRKNRNR